MVGIQRGALVFLMASAMVPGVARAQFAAADCFQSILTEPSATGGVFRFQLNAPIDDVFDVESSSNLQPAAWISVGAVTTSLGRVIVTDTNPPEGGRAFYRGIFRFDGGSNGPQWKSGGPTLIDNGDSELRIGWTGVTDVACYGVLINGQPAGIFDDAVYQILFEGLQPAGEYSIQIIAAGANGNVATSSTLHAYTRLPQEPFQNPSPGMYSDNPGYQLLLHSGEMIMRIIDLVIPARARGFKFIRTYRSSCDNVTPIGYGWDFNYNRHLEPRSNNNLMWFQGNGRRDMFIHQPNGSYLSPPGFFVRLQEKPGGGYYIFHPDCTRESYDTAGRLTEIRDRRGNTCTLTYNAAGQLITVTDDMGRDVDFAYLNSGLLRYFQDWAGRRVTFSYDGSNNLVDATSPAVTDTPNSNNFPNGKTTRYVYDTSNSEAQLTHNLVEIIKPNEVADGSLVPRCRFVYGQTSQAFDRVTSYQYGGSNTSGVPAGGSLTYSYVITAAPTGSVKTTVIDRRSNLTVYCHSSTGHCIQIEETVGTQTIVTAYNYNADGMRTLITHPEGNQVAFVYDTGNRIRGAQGNRLSARETPDGTRLGDQTELLRLFTYEPIANQVRTTTDARGTDATYVPPNGSSNSPSRYTTTYFFDYEEACDVAALALAKGLPVNTIGKMLDDAGMCAAPLGDVNGDGVVSQSMANVVKAAAPTVNLLAGSNQAGLEGDTLQEIHERFDYNSFGQLTRFHDAEENRTTFSYHPEQDPNGDGTIDNPSGDPVTGGYLRQATRDTVSSAGRNSGYDPSPTLIRTLYEYDVVGNVTQSVDGRGIATDFVINSLNQVIGIHRAAACDLLPPAPAEPVPLMPFSYRRYIAYDANDNVIQTQTEDYGDTSSVGANNGAIPFVDNSYTHDILDRRIQITREVNNGESLTQLYRYDANENHALTIYPEGNANAFIYDARDLLSSSSTGAKGPTRGALLAGSDPQNYDVFGGDAAQKKHRYDGNRNRVETGDGGDTDGAAGNNSTLGGDRWRYFYDGYDRFVSLVDSVGNQLLRQYDPRSHVIRVLRFGPTGGASPKTDGNPVVPFSINGVIQGGNLASSNAMEATEYLYDELGRMFQRDRFLFINTISTTRTPDVDDGATSLGKGNLTLFDTCNLPLSTSPTGGIVGCVSTRYEYDRRSRNTFTVEDDEDAGENRWDGADRVVRVTDAESNIVESAYDDSNNLIETRETDQCQTQSGSNEIFLTTYFYDCLNRLHRVVDNVGQTHDYRYDSRDNLVAIADAAGPVNGSNITRRIYPDGPWTDNRINDPGNNTTFRYDGLNRRIVHEHYLTSSGSGDGAIARDYYGALSTGPVVDSSQGSGDGMITVSNDWDKNSRLTSKTDDNANQTQYRHDDLNRVIQITDGVCVPPNPGGRTTDHCVASSSTLYAYDRDHNRTQVVDEVGSRCVITHDAINRATRKDFTLGPAVNGTTIQTYQYDGLSRLTDATDNNSTGTTDDASLTFAYDALSRLIEKGQQVGTGAVRVVSYARRAEDLLAYLEYPNGRTIEYTYDLLDRIKTVTTRGAGSAHVTYDYIGPHRIKQYVYNVNRITHTGIYDGIRRPIGLEARRQNNSLVLGFQHTYDRMNNRLTETKLHDTNNNQNYRNNSIYELTQFTRPSGQPPLHTDWTIDGVRNQDSTLGTSAETRKDTSKNEVYSVNGSNLTHDANSNTKNDLRYTYTYDPLNRVTSARNKSSGLTVGTYVYDPLNRRLQKVVLNSGSLNKTSEFVYGSGEIAEYDSGTLDHQFVRAGNRNTLIVKDQNLDGDSDATGPGDSSLHYHHNPNGSVHGMTDNSAVLKEAYRYEGYGYQTVIQHGPNGQVDHGLDDVIVQGGISDVDNPHLHSGARIDYETGNYAHGSRYLNTKLGRYLSADRCGTWSHGQNHGNPCTYACNNPVNADYQAAQAGSQQAINTINPAGDVSICFSSRGPDSGRRMKPEVSARGDCVRVGPYTRASRCSGTSIGTGTSMAKPHVAGASGLFHSVGWCGPMHWLTSGGCNSSSCEPPADGENDLLGPTKENLFDNVLETAKSNTVSGYVFSLTDSQSDNDTDSSEWTMTGNPKTAGSTGDRYFKVTQDGVIKFKNDSVDPEDIVLQ